ncbi:ATP-binding protein [Dehalococcoidia bacterium]|nr:ATP-binding protein [Dehalococcoidia bacterium]
MEVFKLRDIGSVIADDVSPSFNVFRFKALANEYVHPGSLVGAVISERTFVLGRVSGSIEVNPHESPSRTAVRHAMQIEADYPDEALSTTVYRIYEADIVEQGMVIEGSIDIIEPMDMAKAGASVFIPNEEVISKAMGFQKDLNEALSIGRTRIVGAEVAEGKEEIPENVLLRPDVIQRHIFIAGTTGSGKSYATGILIEEINKFRLPIIILDSQNEYVALTEDLEGRVLRPGTDYTVRLSSLIESEVLDLVPTLRGTVGYELLAFSFLALRREIRENRRREFGLEELLRRMEAEAPTLDVREASLRLGLMRTQSSIQRHDFIGERTNWVDLIKRYPVINIDCARLDLSQLQLVVGATLRELQNLRLRREIPPYVIVLDEVHLLVPEGEDTPCKQVIRENVRIGRHYGICMVLITQSPVDIDKKTIRQCNTRFIFALEPDQLHALQGIKADATEEMLNRLPKMPRGTCILSGTYETIKHALPIKIRSERKTRPGGAAPNIFKEVGETWGTHKLREGLP